jgi:hypothetical protein
MSYGIFTKTDFTEVGIVMTPSVTWIHPQPLPPAVSIMRMFLRWSLEVRLGDKKLSLLVSIL